MGEGAWPQVLNEQGSMGTGRLSLVEDNVNCRRVNRAAKTQTYIRCHLGISKTAVHSLRKAETQTLKLPTNFVFCLLGGIRG